MKLKRLLIGLVGMLLIVGCAAMQTGTEEVRHDVLYTCDCGPQCKCNTVSTKPGDCTCGTKLKWGHVLRIEGDEALLCQCNVGCKCGGLSPDDPTKCMCGSPVKRVSLAGSGIYFCNCGNSCSCNTVSAQPGKCKCGMKLKEMP